MTFNFPPQLSRQQYRYRGSVTNDGKYGSARDFGNIGAGIVAARSGLSWDEARFGFDTYQEAPEPATTQKAQRYGFQIGLQLRNSNEIENEIRWKDIRPLWMPNY